MGQKGGEESCVIILKNDAKFEEELTCVLKIDIGNLVNFTGTLKNLKICCSSRDFFPRYIMFELKNYRADMTMTSYAIFKEKFTFGLKNDTRNLVNFHARSRNPENVHFDGLVLSKVYKVLNEKMQNSYVS